MHSFSIISLNVAINHIILLKTRFYHSMGYILIADSIDLPLTNLTQLALKADTFSVITRSKGH